jgi:Ca2+-binding RTX toxin-like protein
VGITAQALDPDASDTVSYALSDDAGGRFAIDASTGVVTVADASLLDYESAHSHTIEVIATSSDGSTSTQGYTINVLDEAEASGLPDLSDRPAMPSPPATGNTMSGGNGSQTLFGSSANDTIYGGNHDDRLYGNGGDDRLYGQNHDDRLYGGTGDDWLEGGNHEDELHGGTGDDVLLGGQHNDELHGGTGDDWLEGGHHDDLLEGDTGNDVLLGGHHEDILRGGSGDDWLEGGHHADVLEGGDGNDVLWGGVGNSDQMDGGAGDDFFLFREDDGNDFANGGVGWTDVIQLQDASGGDPGSGWTLQLDAGSVVETGADFMRFSADANGSVTLADGSRLDFVDIEALQW